MALATNQIHVWHFNESSGNAADSIGAMTETNNGSVTYGAGLLGNCALLTGSNQYFNNTADPFWTSATPSAYTINVWVQASSLPAFNTDNFILNTDGTTNPGSVRIFYRDEAGTPKYGFRSFDNTGSGTPTSVIVAGTMTLNTWYMWTMTWSGTQIEGFINASSIGTAAISTFGRNDPVPNFARIAGQGSADAFVGKMDEFGVWTRALSGAEITSLYNGGNGFAYPYVSGPTNVKTVDGVAIASVKTMNGVAIGSIKTINGVS